MCKTDKNSTHSLLLLPGKPSVADTGYYLTSRWSLGNLYLRIGYPVACIFPMKLANQSPFEDVISIAFMTHATLKKLNHCYIFTLILTFIYSFSKY